MAPAIGIDLGTTNSRVAVFRDGKVEIIANEIGSRATPSYVAFTDKGRLIGETAKRPAAMNPKNTIYDVKRLIGRRLGDPTIQEDMEHWPFDLVNNNGKPMLKAKLKGEPKIFAPEEISSMIIGKMKQTAEKFLGTEVKDAVITVPAYFNESQRQATKDAGTIAGLNVLRIINEPTAAALAYGLQKDLKGERNVLIYDLGGGTFDVTVLTITEGSVFNVKSTSGDTHLGGEDFDRLLVKFLAEKFRENHGKDMQGNSRAMSHLRAAAETAKRDLTSSTTSTIEIDLLFEGNDFETCVSQRRFNHYCLDLFTRTLKHVELALAYAKMDKGSIDDVVLVGGSTRIPKVQELLKEFFSVKELNLSINPDEAVVSGAAIQAAILSGERHPAIADFLVIDVTPLSIGVPYPNGQMFNIIKRNSQVPFKKLYYFNISPGQTNLTFPVLEGESYLAHENTTLGTLIVYDIPARRAVGVIHVNFELNVNNILKVSLGEGSTYTSEQISILKNNLSENDIVKMVERSESFKEDEKRELERMTVRISLELYIYETKSRLSKNEGNFEDGVMKVLCEEALKWLTANPQATKQEYEDRKKCLQAAEQGHENNKKMMGGDTHTTNKYEEEKSLQMAVKEYDDMEMVGVEQMDEMNKPLSGVTLKQENIEKNSLEHLMLTGQEGNCATLLAPCDGGERL